MKQKMIRNKDKHKVTSTEITTFITKVQEKAAKEGIVIGTTLVRIMFNELDTICNCSICKKSRIADIEHLCKKLKL